MPPRLLVFACGVGVLIGAFTLFDRVLPSRRAEPRASRSRTLQQRYSMFLFGTLITLVTLGVAVGDDPGAPRAKGYIRRDRVIPYVMGANIATWIDTLVAALLLDSPGAFTIVFTEMVAGAVVSLTVLFFLYRPYTALILGLAHKPRAAAAISPCCCRCSSRRRCSCSRSSPGREGRSPLQETRLCLAGYLHSIARLPDCPIARLPDCPIARCPSAAPPAPRRGGRPPARRP